MSFAASRTLQGAKSAMDRTPKNMNASKSIQSSMLSARDLKSNDDFEQVKTKYYGQASVLVEESKALRERLEK